jgi:thioredoxin 1
MAVVQALDISVMGLRRWGHYVESMSDAEELDEIREQKKQELQSQGTGTTDANDASGTERPDAPIHIEGGDHLDEVTNDHDVVLVDFYADWCGPCKMVEPIVEALHDEETAVVAKVDIDQHQMLAQQQQVRGVPTMMLYVDGQPVERMVGAKDKASLESVIAQHA